MEKSVPIIVLARNYSNGLAVARSLGSAGYTVHYIASSHVEGANDIAAMSKYVSSFSEVVASKVKEEDSDPELISEIMKFASDGGQKPILFPTDDYTTSIMDNDRDALSPYFLMPQAGDGKQGSLSALMDKTLQLQKAQEIGLNVPFSVAVSLRDEDISIPEDIPYPAYVKPIQSILGYKTEMKVCNDEEELRAHLAEMRERFSDRDVLVQEFLDIDTEFASAGICLDQEVMLPALIRKTRIGQHGRGVTLTGELVPFDVLGEDVCKKAIELLKNFHYTGNFGMEFNLVGDKVYFNEVNLRSAGEAYAYFKSGINFPLIFVRHILGDDDPFAGEQFKGMEKTLLYDKIAWEDYAYGTLSWTELNTCMEESDIRILCDPDDPEPGDAFTRRLVERRSTLNTRQKRKARREKCIVQAAEAMGWDRETSEAWLDDIREKYSLTYRDILNNSFWECPEEEHEARVEEILGNKEERNELRSEEKPLVVVLSRIYSTGLAVVRSLGSAGYPVDYIGNCHKEGASLIAAQSKYINNSVEVVSRKVDGGNDTLVMAELLKYRKLKKPGERIVLFPTDDYTASVMDSNRDRLKRIFVMPGITDGSEGLMMHKMRKAVQSKMAAESGLNVPAEWIVSLREKDIALPDGIIYPCFVKPIESITGYKREMKLCQSENALRDHLMMLRRRYADRDVLVQEFLEIDQEIDMSGICFDQDVFIPAIIRKTHVAQHERGVTLAGKVVPFEELGEDVVNGVKRLMRAFRYNGMFDLELNIVGDKIYFNEVNLRSGGPNYSYFMSGVNLPAFTVKGLLGQEFDEDDVKVETYGKNFIYEKVAWDDYSAGFINKRQLNKMLAAADIRLLEAKDDPAPTEMFNKMTSEEGEEKRKKFEQRRRNEMKRRVKTTISTVAGAPGLAVRGYPQGHRKNRRDPNSPTPRVLVAGRNWCSNLCMARSLAEGGYEVEILRIVQRKPGDNNLLKWLKPEKYSNSIKAFYFLNSRRRSRRIVNRLKTIADPKWREKTQAAEERGQGRFMIPPEKRMLIIPADDLVAHTIDLYYDELSDYYLMPNIRGEGGHIADMMQKDIQKQLAREAGLPVPNSCVITSATREFVIPDTVTYPCFIKPNVSRNSAKSAMKRCDSEEELLATLKERKENGKSFELLVEDFIEIKRELSYLGLSTEKGVVCPGYFEAVVEGEGSHRGVAMLGRLLPIESAEPLLSEVVKFIESLGFNGLFDVDLIESKDGKIYFVELNMRYGASGYALTKGGANLPAMFADYMFHGTPVDKSCHINNVGATFTSEKVLIDEYREGLIEREQIDELMEKADIHFLKSDTDPKPYKHMVSLYPKAKELREQTLREAEEAARLEAEAEVFSDQ